MIFKALLPGGDISTWNRLAPILTGTIHTEPHLLCPMGRIDFPSSWLTTLLVLIKGKRVKG